jgi:hypothetical protein
MSVLTAARIVLADAPKPLTADAIYASMSGQGLWRNPHARPEAVVAAAIASDIGRRGRASDFRRSGKDSFARSGGAR